MTQTLTEYLIANGSPLLPKGWTYRISTRKEPSSKFPDKMLVIFDAEIRDRKDTVIGRGTGIISDKYLDKVAGREITAATNRAYNNLFRSCGPDYQTVLSYKSIEDIA